MPCQGNSSGKKTEKFQWGPPAQVRRSTRASRKAASYAEPESDVTESEESDDDEGVPRKATPSKQSGKKQATLSWSNAAALKSKRAELLKKKLAEAQRRRAAAGACRDSGSSSSGSGSDDAFTASMRSKKRQKTISRGKNKGKGKAGSRQCTLSELTSKDAPKSARSLRAAAKAAGKIPKVPPSSLFVGSILFLTLFCLLLVSGC